MDSDDGNGCSHPLGFPIRKSPDHSLLAASRSLSQLTTSFFAYLRQGIHTHALSSLTIKSTSHTTHSFRPSRIPACDCLPVCRRYFLALSILVFVMPVNIQLSKISIASAISSRRRNHSLQLDLLNFTSLRFELLVGLGGIEPPTSPLSGVRSSHLSYRPRSALPSNTGGAGRDRTGDLLNANQALSQLSYSPL